MNEAAQTLEGWYALHDFRTIDWTTWKSWPESKRTEALEEFTQLLDEWKKSERDQIGTTVAYSIVGHKADLVLMHMREDLHSLNQLEHEWDKSLLAECLYRSYSYVSIVELSNYLAKSGEDPMANPHVQARLKPIPPDARHICFYPMDKRRQGEDNWYMLNMEKRRELMRSHGMIGRKYAGEVRQIITGSVGLDDWEWGVTLFSDDPLTFKKLVYEMRFDEVSARYGEFGEFYVGNRLDDEQIQAIFHL